MSIYDYKFNDRSGNEVSMEAYKGKVLLIVNTATACGFTPQYEELQEIYDEFKDCSFEVLDFPCNQFGDQAPGSNEEIHSFCTGRFGITFPQESKIDVNGENALPLFKYLTDNTSFKGFGTGDMAALLDDLMVKRGVNPESKEIRWNFTKFLIDATGNIVARFEPTESMDSVKECIRQVLGK